MARLSNRTCPYSPSNHRHRLLSALALTVIAVSLLLLWNPSASAGQWVPVEKPHFPGGKQDAGEPNDKLERLRRQWEVTEIEMENVESVVQKVEKLVKKTERVAMRSWVMPATTLITPTAAGANWKDVFFGASLQNRSRFTPGTKLDMSWSAGMGFLNSTRYVGLEVSYSDYDVDNPLNSGGFSFKFHRNFEAAQLNLAVGWINCITINTPDSGGSLYVVGTRYFQLKKDMQSRFSVIYVHLGFGNGRFKLEKDIIANRNTVSPFGGVALRTFLPVSLIANWTGSDLGVGVSVAPFRRFPLIFSLSAQDVARTAGDGIRYLFAFGYGDSVVSDTFPIGIFRP